MKTEVYLQKGEETPMKLAGKTIAFAGRFTGMKKASYTAEGAEYGFTVKTSVGKGVDLLVAGQKADAAVTKAAQADIPVISEDEYNLWLRVSEKVGAKAGTGTMGDYPFRFRQMVARLAAHPDVQILGFEMRPTTAGARKIKSAEAACGFNFPADAKSLYKQIESFWPTMAPSTRGQISSPRPSRCLTSIRTATGRTRPRPLRLC